MRALFVLAAIAASPLVGVQSARAETAPPPWCLKAVMAEDWAVDLCYFRTFESCNQERFLYGPKSFCIVNPHYYFRYGEPDQTPRAGRRAQQR
jgi:hypothetical protein